MLKDDILKYIFKLKTPNLSNKETSYIDNFYDTINN